mgnify:CR=1 FL=1
MTNFILIAVVLALAIVVVKYLKSAPRSNKACPYQSRQVLFTPAERSFLGVLEQALDSRYRVMGKVRLCDVIEVQKGLPKADWRSAHNKIDRKHLDFVVLHKHDLSVAAVIELDDKTHQRKDRVSRDDFLNNAFKTTNIPFLRFPAQKGYAIEEVKGRFLDAVSPVETNGAPPQTPSTTSDVTKLAEPANEAPMPDVQTDNPEAPICEKCGADMVKRQAKKGQHAGKWFWACTKFPKCRAVVAIEP